MQDRDALSKYRIEKSEEDLKTSDYLLKQKFFAQSLNRSYYAIFHATRALFALDGFNARTHNGLLAVFNKEYIHKQILPSEYYTIIKSAERIRMNSDYQDFYIATKQQAEEQLENAKKFLAGIKDFINKNYLSTK